MDGSTKPNHPAFPTNPRDGRTIQYAGLTLRAYFAAQALPEFIRVVNDNWRRSDDGSNDKVHATVAELAVGAADALIAELSKPKEAPVTEGEIKSALDFGKTADQHLGE